MKVAFMSYKRSIPPMIWRMYKLAQIPVPADSGRNFFELIIINIYDNYANAITTARGNWNCNKNVINWNCRI